ncbi:hypothetical protein BDD12DRAFT_29888 [Trichophaea hybrida]|nr:hypothetical protein BDD12DRAFT_29888 [Trichophaea hybrida]
MGDDNTNQKRRKSKWATLYSNMTIAQTEQRLGFRIRSLKPIPVKTMIANASKDLGKDTQAIEQTKAKVYDRIVEHLQVEGFPTEADPDFKEVNINYLVHSAISPILADFICRTGRGSVQLQCEKEIASTDGETGGMEEFIVVDLTVGEENFIFIVEAKRSSLGLAMKQCLLVMKDMSDNNGGSTVYRFVTTGDS